MIQVSIWFLFGVVAFNASDVPAFNFGAALKHKHKDVMLTVVKELSIKGKRVPDREKVHHTVNFAIHQRDIESLEKHLHEISDPTHPLYRQHLTREEIGAWTRNTDSSERVLAYLQQFDPRIQIKKRSLYDEYITASAPVTVWETMLNTEFHEFRYEHYHPERVMIAADQYSLPEDIHDHVMAVFNVAELPPILSQDLSVKFESKLPQNDKAEMLSPQDVVIDGAVRPSFLNYFYNIASNKGNNLTNQCIYAAIGQTLSLKDLTQFQTTYNLPLQGISENIGGFVTSNACANLDDCAEANLDVQYIMATAQNVPTVYYYSDQSWPEWCASVASMSDPPDVISISYGSYEAAETTSSLLAFYYEAVKLGK